MQSQPVPAAFDDDNFANAGAMVLHGERYNESSAQGDSSASGFGTTDFGGGGFGTDDFGSSASGFGGNNNDLMSSTMTSSSTSNFDAAGDVDPVILYYTSIFVLFFLLLWTNVIILFVIESLQFEMFYVDWFVWILRPKKLNWKMLFVKKIVLWFNRKKK